MIVHGLVLHALVMPRSDRHDCTIVYRFGYRLAAAPERVVPFLKPGNQNGKILNRNLKPPKQNGKIWPLSFIFRRFGLKF